MKKFAVLIAVVLVAALAAPALSATNPFMDVPMNHWAYDAINTLYSRNIMRGYDDGLFKGNQQTTRYEMANAIARLLEVIDYQTASKEDMDMLKQLVIEFQNELDTLGAHVEVLDDKISIFESRLGGWHIHGVLALDVNNQSANDALDTQASDGSVGFDDAKLIFERTWGDNDEYYFMSRLNGGGGGNAANFDRFYVEMPFFFDTKFTIGRFNWAWEGAYKLGDNFLPATGSWFGDQLLTDWGFAGMGLTKNFGLGTVNLAFAHPDAFSDRFADSAMRMWMILLGANLQFTEKLGLDIGAQAFIGDNAETFHTNAAGDKYYTAGDISFNSLWTAYAGLRFDFNDNIGFRGIFYHQAADTQIVNDDGSAWIDYGYGFKDKPTDNDYIDDSNHWAAIIKVGQEALKYTSVWLEYGMFDKGFMARNNSGIFFSGSPVLVDNYLDSYGSAAYDVSYWRVGLGQEWSDRWATHIFYYGYNVEDGKPKAGGGRDDASPSEIGAGVQYKLNDSTTMGLNFIHIDSDYDAEDPNEETEDNIIKFRTKIVF